MLQITSIFSKKLRRWLHAWALPAWVRPAWARPAWASTASAPFEIYGAHDRGCQPGDDYLYQGFRYVHDLTRDVLVREDVDAQTGQCTT